MQIWSSMDATSSNKHGANEKFALDKPNTMTVDKSQRMHAHMPGWGTNELPHCKKWKTLRPLTKRNITLDNPRIARVQP